MKLSKSNIVRKGVTLALMTAIVFGTSVPAFAEDITQGITAGTFTGATTLSADPTFGAKQTSYTAQTSISTNSPTFTVDDASGETEGWTVTMESSALTHSLGAGAYDLLATAVTASALGATTLENGASATGLTAPTSALTIGAEGGQTVLSAIAGAGQGTYTRAVTLTIALPANVHVGEYSGTVTMTTAQLPA